MADSLQPSTRVGKRPGAFPESRGSQRSITRMSASCDSALPGLSLWSPCEERSAAGRAVPGRELRGRRGAPVEGGRGAGGGGEHKEWCCRHKAARNERRQTNVLQKRKTQHKVTACYCERLGKNFCAVTDQKKKVCCFIFCFYFKHVLFSSCTLKSGRRVEPTCLKNNNTNNDVEGKFDLVTLRGYWFTIWLQHGKKPVVVATKSFHLHTMSHWVQNH